MDEFVNRMDKQRKILKVVNTKINNKEELCGLSKKAIERWIQVNGITSDSNISNILFKLSEKLFFLACKSQEQISDDYKNISSEISVLYNELSEVLV